MYIPSSTIPTGLTRPHLRNVERESYGTRMIISWFSLAWLLYPPVLKPGCQIHEAKTVDLENANATPEPGTLRMEAICA